MNAKNKTAHTHICTHSITLTYPHVDLCGEITEIKRERTTEETSKQSRESYIHNGSVCVFCPL